MSEMSALDATLKPERTRMTYRICENCRVWLTYCTSWIGEDGELDDSVSFVVTDGQLSAVW